MVTPMHACTIIASRRGTEICIFPAAAQTATVAGDETSLILPSLIRGATITVCPGDTDETQTGYSRTTRREEM